MKRSAKKAAPRPASKRSAEKGEMRAEGARSPAVRPRRKTPKNPGDNPGSEVPMRAQTHGGALRTGGTNKGGPGRPRNEARELSLAGYFENLPRLIRIAAGTEHRLATDAAGNVVRVQPTFRESIEAMRELGNRGIGKRVELEELSSPIVLAVTVGPEVAQERSAG